MLRAFGNSEKMFLNSQQPYEMALNIQNSQMGDGRIFLISKHPRASLFNDGLSNENYTQIHIAAGQYL
jgi:hypothetical protein